MMAATVTASTDTPSLCARSCLAHLTLSDDSSPNGGCTCVPLKVLFSTITGVEEIGTVVPPSDPVGCAKVGGWGGRAVPASPGARATLGPQLTRLGRISTPINTATHLCFII